MKFATIISGVGFKPDVYPYLSELPITLYDRNNCILKDATYSSPIFSKRPDSLVNFIHFLNVYEKSKDLSCLEVKVDENILCIYIKGKKPAVFMRAK